MPSRTTKNLTALFLLSAMFLFTGCGGPPPETTSAKPQQKVVIGVQHGKTSAPQLIHALQKGVVARDFPGMDFEPVWESGNFEDIHTDLSAMAEDLGRSRFDFVYIDFGSLVEVMNYGFKSTGSSGYTIIAGAVSRNRQLCAKPEIRHIRDLDGKTVGIYNKNHDLEMLLNRSLETAGLKTTSLGGTVRIKYAQQSVLVKDFAEGKIQAVFTHPSKWDDLIEKGHAHYLELNPQFNKHQAFTVLAVNNRFLKKYPDITKKMVELQIDSTQAILQDPPGFFDTFEQYFKGSISRQTIEKFYGQGWWRCVPSYDVNQQYIQETYSFMEKAHYIQGLQPPEKLVDLSFFDQVLKKKGLKPQTKNAQK